MNVSRAVPRIKQIFTNKTVNPKSVSYTPHLDCPTLSACSHMCVGTLAHTHILFSGDLSATVINEDRVLTEVPVDIASGFKVVKVNGVISHHCSH